MPRAVPVVVALLALQAALVLLFVVPAPAFAALVDALRVRS